MDVTPPTVLRRLGIALAGVAVAALTGAACALSFDDLRALAIHGEARPDLAFLYPAGFDALLVVALIGVLLLRPARLLVRLQAALVLIVLILAAAAVNVVTTARLAVDVRQAALGVAVAPWVMLALGLWLWLLLIKHVQARRTPEEIDDGTAEQDLVPFTGRPTPPPPPPVTLEPHAVSEGVTRWAAPASQEPVPAPREPEPAEAVADTVEVPRPVLDEPAHTRHEVSEAVHTWQAGGQPWQPDDARAAQADLAHDAAQADPDPAHGTAQADPEVSDPAHGTAQADPEAPDPAQSDPEAPDPAHDAAQADDERPGATQPWQAQPEAPQPGRTPHEPDQAPLDEPQAADEEAQAADEGAQTPYEEAPAESAQAAHVEPEPLGEPEPAVQEQQAETAAKEPRPVRWGDRKKPADVLVHPRVPERDKDTQPLRVVTSETRQNPDPEHGPEAADAQEAARREQLGDAPSGRLRSTPLPPDSPDE
ncbi:DUF2637 domain-containing protein [Nonomuraea sediminis]|uniref:DUF2637 domain-containing protein n=1 Tax=Nonomuraea sediminis TaxID=2835864 RepID=UPI001BDCB8EB|nr:DUF2637 domain-containing protein [Nonomuraea sediminis]